MGKFATPRQASIQRLLGIKIGSLPFTYLGVPIFCGRPKSEYFLPIADKIRSKLSVWKGRQLSQAARLQLIESVIQCYLIHIFQVYEWPKSLLRKLERWTRNFFWNGDPLKCGSSLVSSNKCCVPKEQGGLGLRNLFLLNRALLLNRSWEVASKASILASFLHDQFLTVGLQPSTYYKKSSVWLGIRKLWPILQSNVRWIVGNGDCVQFWKDNWLGAPLTVTCSIDNDHLDF